MRLNVRPHFIDVMRRRSHERWGLGTLALEARGSARCARRDAPRRTSDGQTGAVGGRRRLSTQILAGQVAVLTIAGAAGFGLYVRHTRTDLDRQYERRALVVAQAAAANLDIRRAMVAGDPNGTIAPLAESLRRATGASYVVVIDRAGRRHSHPNAALIGERVEEPVIALDGH